MPEFKSHRSYWDFAVAVTRRERFIRSADQVEFLQTVVATSVAKQEIITAGSIVWRAQVGHGWRPEKLAEDVCEEVPTPFSPERMKPWRDKAIEGRTNPKGIPCLYVATEEETAVGEVRPGVGASVSIAQLKTARELRVINCTTDDRGLRIYFEEPDAPERERAVWRDIDRAFAEPVAVGDVLASYVPTQIIAEVFRNEGFDGVAYRSSFGPGHNIAFFDLDAADVINCSLVEVKSLKLNYTQTADQYFVTKHYEKNREKQLGSGSDASHKT